MKNKTYILALAVILSLSGCGVFKKVFRSSSKTKENTEVTTNKEVTTEVKDKSTITIKEKLDSTIRTKGITTGGESKPIDNLNNIKNLTVLSNDLVTVRQTYDSLSKKLQTHVDILPQTIPVQFDKTTTINKDIETNTKLEQDSTAKTEIKVKQKEIKKEPVNVFWYVILTIGVVAVIYFISRKFFANKFGILK